MQFISVIKAEFSASLLQSFLQFYYYCRQYLKQLSTFFQDTLMNRKIQRSEFI